MAGFAARTHAATGTAMPLHAKALGLERDGRRFVLVTVDLLGVTAAMRQRIGATLSRTHHLETEAWMLAASHTHCGPVVDDQLSVAYDLDAAQRSAIAAYTASLESTIARLVGAALERLEPADVTFGEGRRDIRREPANSVPAARPGGPGRAGAARGAERTVAPWPSSSATRVTTRPCRPR